MIRNWKTLTMYSLLSAAGVVAAPPPVVIAQEKPNKADEDLKASIEALTKRIAALEAKKLSDSDKEAIGAIMAAELKKLEDGAIARLSKSLDTVQGEQIKHKLQLETHKLLIDQLTKRIDSLNTAPQSDKAVLDALKAIQETIAKLGPTEKRTMFAAPNGITATTGRVMLVNHYGDELLFIINGVGHRVPGNTSKLVENIPIGSVGVEVFSTRFGVFHRQGTTLAGGDTFTLTANPPR